MVSGLPYAARHTHSAAPKSPLTVVTNAPNVEVGKRVVVATEGAVVGDITIKPTNVGGKKSEGMLLDSPALGWKGGAAGMAAVVPDSFECGVEPPSSRPVSLSFLCCGHD